MSKNYVEQRNGGYYIAGTRVSLASVVKGYQNGDSAETIHENFASLTQEQVYGAIAFYLANREIVDECLRRRRAAFEKARSAQTIPAGFRTRREAARSHLQPRT